MIIVFHYGKLYAFRELVLGNYIIMGRIAVI